MIARLAVLLMLIAAAPAWAAPVPPAPAALPVVRVRGYTLRALQRLSLHPHVRMRGQVCHIAGDFFSVPAGHGIGGLRVRLVDKTGHVWARARTQHWTGLYRARIVLPPGRDHLTLRERVPWVAPGRSADRIRCATPLRTRTAAAK